MRQKRRVWIAHHKQLGEIYCECGIHPVMGFHNGPGWYVLIRIRDCYPSIVRVFKDKKSANGLRERLTGRRWARRRKKGAC